VSIDTGLPSSTRISTTVPDLSDCDGEKVNIPKLHLKEETEIIEGKSTGDHLNFIH
jgi:hypothetical protein